MLEKIKAMLTKKSIFKKEVKYLVVNFQYIYPMSKPSDMKVSYSFDGEDFYSLLNKDDFPSAQVIDLSVIEEIQTHLMKDYVEKEILNVDVLEEIRKTLSESLCSEDFDEEDYVFTFNHGQLV